MPSRPPQPDLYCKLSQHNTSQTVYLKTSLRENVLNKKGHGSINQHRSPNNWKHLDGWVGKRSEMAYQQKQLPALGHLTSSQGPAVCERKHFPLISFHSASGKSHFPILFANYKYVLSGISGHNEVNCGNHLLSCQPRCFVTLSI